MKYIIRIFFAKIAHDYFKLSDKAFLIALFSILVDCIYNIIENIIKYIFS